VTDSDSDVTRRTQLAAERTWLAWWRSGIAAAAAAVGVGGVIPELVGGTRTPYVALGAGYALLAIAVFLGAARRQIETRRALEAGGYAELGDAWILGLTVSAGLLALATLIVLIVV
jgi:inner membrane protein YidH